MFARAFRRSVKYALPTSYVFYKSHTVAFCDTSTATQDLRGPRTLVDHTPVKKTPLTHEEVREMIPDDFSHSSTFSNFESFKSNSYHLELTVDFDDNKITGYVDFDFEKVGDSPYIILDTKWLEIDYAADITTGEKLQHVLCTEHDVFGSPLVIKAPEGDNPKVRVYFQCLRDGAAQFLPPSCTSGTHPYVFTQCQAIWARSLFPCQDCPAAKSKWSAGITVPAWATALMSCTRTGCTDLGAVKRYTFEQRNKIPSYLVALAAGEINGIQVGPRSTVWAEPSVVDAAAWEFNDCESFIQAGEKICGPYKWDNYDVLCLPPAFPYGGMENPQLTFLTPTLLAGDRSLVSVLAHEITHSWSGNLVTNESWNEFWLNEGFTVYIEGAILRNKYGAEYANAHRALGMQAWRDAVARYGDDHEFTKLIQNLPGCDPDDAFSSVPYMKGREFLFVLEKYAGGPENFEEWLKAYFARFADQTVTSQEMKNFYCVYFQDRDLSGINWDKWLYEPGIPEEDLVPFTSLYLDDADRKVEKFRRVYLQDTPFNFSGGFVRLYEDEFAYWSSTVTQVFLDRLTVQMKEDLATKKWGKSDMVRFLLELDKTMHMHLTESNNCEIKFRWLMLCCTAGCEIKKAAKMATEVGRMKYVRPLYRAIAENDLEFARELFLANQEKYHPICKKMVRSDLKL